MFTCDEGAQADATNEMDMASDVLIPTPASGGRSGVPHTAEEWDQHRSLFTRLYVGENRTLKEIRQIFARDHGFHATFVTHDQGFFLPCC